MKKNRLKGFLADTLHKEANPQKAIAYQAALHRELQPRVLMAGLVEEKSVEEKPGKLGQTSTP